MVAKTPDKAQIKSREPFVGAIVYFVDPDMGDVYPGIVTRVLSGGRVLLTVFQPGATPFPFRNFVLPDHTAKTRGTWHWPPEE